jgi:RNA polymerase sigma factor (sigma-70 family)
VDDDESVRRGVGRLLRSAGHEVEVFPSAQEFLQEVTSDRPGCIVLDVRMPGIDGLDLQGELAARGIILPIVFITGFADVPMSVQAMKAGAIDFLPKPFDDDALVSAVRLALEKDREKRLAKGLEAEIRSLFERLTPREREVFEGVVAGMLNKQIAAKLGIAEKTVKVHRGRVMEKMEVDSVADLVRMAERLDNSSG